jgi:hypothetical protein
MNAPPPIIARAAPGNTWYVAVLLAVVALGSGAVVYFFNPVTHSFYPACRFHQLTGLNCPGCGATRACYALLHGDIFTSFRDNALFVLSLPAVLLRGAWLAVARWQRRPAGPLVTANWAWAICLVALVFAVLRNLPAFAFLSPA